MDEELTRAGITRRAFLAGGVATLGLTMCRLEEVAAPTAANAGS